MKAGNLSRRHMIALTAGAGAAISRSEALALMNQTGSGARGRVLILGAGMAGLTAGAKLRSLGYDVSVLEARTRPGGRVHTIREPFSDDLHAEAGAGRIPITHNLTLEYVRRYKLAMVPFFPAGGRDVFLWNGRRQVIPRDGNPDLSGLDVNLNERERQVGFAGLSGLYMDKMLDEIRRLPFDGWPFENLNAYKDQTLEAFLADQGASGDAIRYLATGFEKDSVLDFFHDASSHAVPKLWKIKDGNDLLPRALAGELKDRIRYGAVVRQITRTDRDVTVSYMSNGISHTETADHVICTLPPTVLRDIALSPDVSAGKRAAIDGLYLGPVARVFIQTRTRFWEAQGLNGFATIDRPMEIWAPGHNLPGRRGILMSYIYEDLARDYSAMPQPEQIARTLDLFEQIHPGTKDAAETALTWSWTNEPYSKGAYLVTRPGEFDLLPHAGSPEGRLHFAGEHTSPWPGWIQGAIHSGLRVAGEVLGAR